MTDKGGRLAILRIPSHHFVLHDVDGYYGEPLRGAEPGDWYANKPIPPEDIEDTGLRLDPGQEPDFPSKLALHKTADKFHDFLMSPKSRPDLQTPEGQEEQQT